MAHAQKHVSSVGTYVVVWAVLMVLLVATVLAVKVDLDHSVFPGANIALAMLIATVKALVVVLWFMHVKDASRLTWVFAGASFVWLGLLIFGTLQEYETRGWFPGWETPIADSYTPAHRQLDDGDTTEVRSVDGPARLQTDAFDTKAISNPRPAPTH